MKRLLLTALIAASATTMMADDNDYRYLTAQTDNGEQSIELATIQKITFEDSNVLITTTEGVVTIAQSELQKLFFSATPSAIKALPGKAKGLVVQAGTLTANGNGLLYIYNASGVLQHMAMVEGKARISLGNLPKGLYIISLGNETIKVTHK